MASHICCTVQRCMTPTEPIFKRVLRAGRPLTAPAEGDSRYTSARTEELNEIRCLFQPSNIAETAIALNTLDENSFKSSTASSKHSKLTQFFKRRLSRHFSKSKKSLKADPGKLRQTKDEIRSTLLTQDGPDAGGYDLDATVLDSVEEPSTPQIFDDDDYTPRGRSRLRQLSPQEEDSAQRQLARRLSLSLTAPRISLEGHCGFRRSHSMGRLDSPPTMAMRLPSFSQERETSNSWKRSVMETLRISSTSTSALVQTPIRLPSRKDLMSATWPLRDVIAARTSLDTPLIRNPSSIDSEAGEECDVTPTKDAEATEVSEFGVLQPGLEKNQAGTSSSSGGRPHFFGRPERRPNRTSLNSVHLYNMGISRHLRSASSLNRSGMASKLTTAAHTRNQTPSRPSQQLSKSGFLTSPTASVPRIAKSAPDLKRDGASSTYSTRPNSPTEVEAALDQFFYDGALDQQKRVPAPKWHVASPSRSNAPSQTSQDRKTTPIKLSDDRSLGSLSDESDKSTKSSKRSRFREDFDAHSSKKSKKRRSIASLFGKTPRGKNPSVESFDGVVDEPRRLQRAMALSEQSGATGLLAKAIQEKQKEKAALYLKGNKEQAARDVFRQRSASFMKPAGESLTAQEANMSVPGLFKTQDQQHRRSTSDTFLTPEFTASGALKAPEQVPRARSSSHLTPEFKTSIFASPDLLAPESRSVSKGRTLSIDIDPAALEDAPIGHVRRPSFRLNDMPALLETPEPSIVAPRAAKPSESKAWTVDEVENDRDLGAWSCYPSHTREKRSGSATIKDDVKTRDFAFDVNPLARDLKSSSCEQIGISLRKKGKKKKRGGILQSKSMSLGRDFVRSYSKLFRSTSAEWLSHGKGHRSSISAGGALDAPELEVLPPVFAPLPVIPDREQEEDAGLTLSPDEIDLQQIKHRRADHGHSFVDLHTKGAPSRMDGPADAKTATEYSTEAGELASPEQDSASPSEAFPAFSYAREYESCVMLPPKSSHSTISRAAGLASFLPQPRTPRSRAGSGAGSDTVEMIDRMLASQPTSTDVSPLPSPLASPLLAASSIFPAAATAAPAHVGANTVPRRQRREKKSVSSVTSLRASSMDLLKTLKEAEEKERQRALEGLLGIPTTRTTNLDHRPRCLDGFPAAADSPGKTETGSDEYVKFPALEREVAVCEVAGRLGSPPAPA